MISLVPYSLPISAVERSQFDSKINTTRTGIINKLV
jgi:hypothetical protein